MDTSASAGANGRWNIVVKTPMGNQESVLELHVEGSALSGALHEKNGDIFPITDGKAEGSALAWRAKVKKPLPMNLQFTATLDGDAISGGAKSPFGTAPFTGTRARAGS